MYERQESSKGVRWAIERNVLDAGKDEGLVHVDGPVHQPSRVVLLLTRASADEAACSARTVLASVIETREGIQSRSRELDAPPWIHNITGSSVLFGR